MENNDQTPIKYKRRIFYGMIIAVILITHKISRKCI